MKKYGTGKVIPEKGDDQKLAKKNWTEQDQEELEAEGTKGADPAE
jgi:hypothetical protein